ECGEPTIGSAWIQFDLRYYVVALLFVIFDVEVAFFFPWSVVFGQANTVANAPLESAAVTERLQLAKQELLGGTPDRHLTEQDQRAVKGLAWIAFFDILVFFGVLLVGFAYLWRRGDIAWVRSTAAEKAAAAAPVPSPAPAGSRVLVGAGHGS